MKERVGAKIIQSNSLAKISKFEVRIKVEAQAQNLQFCLKTKNIFEECTDVIEPSVNNDEHYEWLEQVTSTKTIVNEYEPCFFFCYSVMYLGTFSHNLRSDVSS